MARNVFEVLDGIAEAVQELRTILEPLARLTGGDQPAARATKAPTAPKRRRRRKASASATKKGAAASKAKKPGKASKKPESWRRSAGLLGGLLRYMSAADRAKIKAIQAEKGIEAAIAAARAHRTT